MPFGFHPLPMLVILAIALLIFGPKKLPEMGASIGKSIKAFQNGMKELKESNEEEAAAVNLKAIESEIASKRSASVSTEMPKSDVVETKVD
jgi:sec-independent protein translocase protein TatA